MSKNSKRQDLVAQARKQQRLIDSLSPATREKIRQIEAERLPISAAAALFPRLKSLEEHRAKERAAEVKLETQRRKSRAW